MTQLFYEKLTQHALNTKYIGDSAIDALMASNEKETMQQLNLKNVCAPISGELLDRLESVLGILNMSKREFFQLAIIDAVDKAEFIIDEYEVLDEHYVKNEEAA